jgi:hypothetical protein
MAGTLVGAINSKQARRKNEEQSTVVREGGEKYRKIEYSDIIRYSGVAEPKN